MSELKSCPTPRTDALIESHIFSDARKNFLLRLNSMNDFARTLKPELIATQDALKECGEVLEAQDCCCIVNDGFTVVCPRCEALSNPILKQLTEKK